MVSSIYCDHLWHLTHSSPVVSYGYTSKCSEPYWSNLPFLIVWHSGTPSLPAWRTPGRGRRASEVRRVVSDPGRNQTSEWAQWRRVQQRSALTVTCPLLSLVQTVLSVVSVCVCVSLFVCLCLSCLFSDFSKCWPRNFIFGMQIHLTKVQLS